MHKKNTVHVSDTLHVIADHFTVYRLTAALHRTVRPARLTYLLTPWSRAPLEKLTGSAASQEIPRIFGTRRFLTVPTSAVA